MVRYEVSIETEDGPVVFAGSTLDEAESAAERWADKHLEDPTA